MKKKKQASVILFLLAIFCLLAIGTILASGILNNKTQQKEGAKRQIDTNVLGELIEPQITTATTQINRFIQGPLQETKETLTQKLVETEKEIVNNIQKEITTLTQSQIDSLKIQICRDLGVIKP